MLAIEVIQVFGIRKTVLDVALRAAFKPAREPHHAAGIFHRQRLQRDSVEGGKKSCVDADAQRESRDGDRGKSRIFAQHAKGIAKIVRKIVQPCETPCASGELLDFGNIAELASSRGAGVLRPAPGVKFGALSE